MHYNFKTNAISRRYYTSAVSYCHSCVLRLQVTACPSPHISTEASTLIHLHYPSHPLRLSTSRVDESRCISCETFCTWHRASNIFKWFFQKIGKMRLHISTNTYKAYGTKPISQHSKHYITRTNLGRSALMACHPLSTSPSLWSNSDLCCLCRQSYVQKCKKDHG